MDNGVLRQMTQVEKDALIAEEEQARINHENARILDIDDKVSLARTTDFPMEKVDNAIDAISNLSEAKLFLKRLCRYVAKNI